ncbi:MAG: GIY-YIG nuclease family protein, partial [Tidjanibacter sp.]|nr:GIY-YIG nuclease family protein [Tidjanibacter sp.]
MAEKERIARLKEQVAALPTTPGVYQFFNSSGEIIYVGKAKNLRRRVSSYFVDRTDHSAKVKVMVGRIERLEHIDTATEQDALLLENSLIKSLQPRYNILLKDDKTYPWIVVRREHFP